MPRFVVLFHDAPGGPHYDWMFDVGDTLKTWSLAESPEADRKTTCRALPDHRRAYLDYEGPVSGNRGTVTRWDQGTYRVLEQTATRWVLELEGVRLFGRVMFELSEGGNTRGDWLCLYAPGQETESHG